MFRGSIFVAAALATLPVPVSAGPVEGRAEPASAAATAGEHPWQAIDVAIALDTSGSMEFLIEAARLKLWEIVQELNTVEPTPSLRVALLTFGNNRNAQTTGWVGLEHAFTADLDAVSERLFELTSEGGNEYVGRVIQVALANLDWSASEEGLRLLFVAGNERADQDPSVSLEDMAVAAKRQEVQVQAIFCGAPTSADAESWLRLAELVGRPLATIDQRSSAVAIPSPVDDELAKLGSALNETFVPMTQEGAKRKEALDAQDERVAKLGSAAAASRVQVKGSSSFAAGWDLVDAVERGAVDPYTIDRQELPEPLRSMTGGELAAYVEDARQKRAALQERIDVLSAKRRAYIGQQLKTKRIDTSRSFDTVVNRVIREELERRGLATPGEAE